MKKTILGLITAISSLVCCPLAANADYWLVIGSYRQGPGARPQVSGITSPSIYAIPMKSLAACEKAGEKITEKIYKPVWMLDNKWVCINDDE